MNVAARADLLDMPSKTIAAGLLLASIFAGPGGVLADSRVRLKSGREIIALRSWTEGGILHLQLKSGMMTVPTSDVASVDEIAARQSLPPTQRARPEPGAVESGGDDSQAPSQQAPPPPLEVDKKVPEVPHEDLQTKMERLDGLSMQTHRQLSIARTQGQPQEKLDALQHKIEEIDRQRTATMKHLGASR